MKLDSQTEQPLFWPTLWAVIGFGWFLLAVIGVLSTWTMIITTFNINHIEDLTWADDSQSLSFAYYESQLARTRYKITLDGTLSTLQPKEATNRSLTLSSTQESEETINEFTSPDGKWVATIHCTRYTRNGDQGLYGPYTEFCSTFNFSLSSTTSPQVQWSLTQNDISRMYGLPIQDAQALTGASWLSLLIAPCLIIPLAITYRSRSPLAQLGLLLLLLYCGFMLTIGLLCVLTLIIPAM